MRECIAQSPLLWKENILPLRLFSVWEAGLPEGEVGGCLAKESSKQGMQCPEASLLTDALALLASCLESLFPELRNTPRSLAPRKHMPFQEAGQLFSANSYPVAIAPFGFTPDSSEVLPLLSAFPFFPPERPI